MGYPKPCAKSTDTIIPAPYVQRVLENTPWHLKLTSNVIFKNSSLQSNCDKFPVNNSSSRNMSTINTGSNKPDGEKRKLVEIEMELLKEEGYIEIPSYISAEEWLNLVDMGNLTARKKYLRYLYLNEQKAINDDIKNEQSLEFNEEHRKQVQKEIEESEETGLPSYGLWRNTIFLKWTDTRMNYINASRIITAASHGQPIVFDNSYDDYMSRQHKTDIGKQFAAAINCNRLHPDPFYYHICNFNLEDELSRRILRNVPTLLDESYPVQVHHENYLDCFSRERLVYITPSAREDMTHFDPNAVYVIANLIRQGRSNQVEVARVKKEGIKMQKFPLDRYLDWGLGTKSLPINIIMNILLDFRHTGSWVKTFDRHIPKRKLANQNSASPNIKKVISKPQYSKKGSNYDSKKWFV